MDASVVIAVWERDDVHHEPATALLLGLAGADLAMSALTVAEVLVNPAAANVGDAALADLVDMGVRIVGLTAGDVVPLASLRAETGLRMPDACVLHAAAVARGTVATFDARLGAAAHARGLHVIGL
nr:PIN domain-containing protein [Knoellia sp. DB2414S]